MESTTRFITSNARLAVSEGLSPSGTTNYYGNIMLELNNEYLYKHCFVTPMDGTMDLPKLVDEMFDVMREGNGVGLAANLAIGLAENDSSGETFLGEVPPTHRPLS